MIPISEIVNGEVTISRSIGTRHGKGIVVLNISQKCALRCVYCYSSSTITGLEMSLENVSKVIKEISKINPRLVILSGGEPLLYPTIEYVFQMLNDNNIKFVISSSGMFISDRHVDMLKKYDVDYIGISLDIPSRYDSKIRVGSNFDKIVESIRMLVNNKINVGIRMTLTWTSMYTIEDMFKLCSKYGIHRLCIYHLAPSGRGVDTYSKLKPSREIETLFLNYLMKLVKYYKNIDVLTVTEPSDFLTIALLSSNSKREFEDTIGRFYRRCRCSAGRSIISIYPDCTVYPCQFNNSKSLGNLIYESIEDILSKRYEHSYCTRCRLYEYCRGCSIRVVERFDKDCTLYGLYTLAVSARLNIDDWKIKLLEEIFST